MPIARCGVREAVDVAEIVRVLRREQRTRHEDVALQHRRDRIEPLAAVVRKAEAREISVRHERRRRQRARAA